MTIFIHNLKEARLSTPKKLCTYFFLKKKKSAAPNV